MGFMERLEAMPSKYRWMMIPLILVVLGGGYWYFSYQPQAEAIARLERQIDQQRFTLQKYQKIAAQYDRFKEQVAELELQLQEALAQLPKQREIPDLIRQMSDLGVRAGLQINLLRPQPERAKEFYAEVPITIKVSGSYHATGQFFDAIGDLPRLVSVSNIQMTRNADELDVQCLATTFRFLEEPVKGTAKKKG
jgi:type IV pilus assembly protein PilO